MMCNFSHNTHSYVAQHTHNTTSFNGAATYSLRKVRSSMLPSGVRRMLQWGRNILVAESWAHSGNADVRKQLQWGRNILVAESLSLDLCTIIQLPASMGPQHTRCGKHGIVSTLGRPGSCFNGAATYSLRKALRPWIWQRRWSALQWGRNILVAERRPRGRRRCSNHMWLQWGRNILVAESTAANSRPPISRPLQWGRNILVAESQPCPNLHLALWRLQWGRNILVAESETGETFFNLAAELQWGRNILVAESSMELYPRSISSRLQWGRNILVAESCPLS